MCKTKRLALSELLDYNINLFESGYLGLDADDKPEANARRLMLDHSLMLDH